MILPTDSALQMRLPRGVNSTIVNVTLDAKAHYMRARFSDPSIGRFLTADPLTGAATQPQTLNRYAYALNNPTNRTDPTGLASEGSTSRSRPLTMTSLQADPFQTVDCAFATAEIAAILGIALFVIGAFSGYHPLIAGTYLGAAAILIVGFYVSCEAFYDP